jgi:hypothetical protein
MAMSSLIVNAYLCDGFGAQIYSSYYKQLLLLAAVMYVDDTDLIHWAWCPSYSPDQLIAAAQTATYAWGGLAIATGAAMKPEKCYAYFSSYWCDRGCAKLRTINALPGSIASITLPNGVIAPSAYVFRYQMARRPQFLPYVTRMLLSCLESGLVPHLKAVNIYARWHARDTHGQIE